MKLCVFFCLFVCLFFFGGGGGVKSVFLMTIDRDHGDEFALRSHASISFKFNL